QQIASGVSDFHHIAAGLQTGAWIELEGLAAVAYSGIQQILAKGIAHDPGYRPRIDQNVDIIGSPAGDTVAGKGVDRSDQVHWLMESRSSARPKSSRSRARLGL